MRVIERAPSSLNPGERNATWRYVTAKFKSKYSIWPWLTRTDAAVLRREQRNLDRIWNTLTTEERAALCHLFGTP